MNVLLQSSLVFPGDLIFKKARDGKHFSLVDAAIHV